MDSLLLDLLTHVHRAGDEGLTRDAFISSTPWSIKHSIMNTKS